MKESESPIRKQLVKKLVNYFDTLESKNKEEPCERSRSRSSRLSRRASISPTGRKSVLEEYEEENQIIHYEDGETRQEKLEELKDLMKAELIKVK